MPNSERPPSSEPHSDGGGDGGSERRRYKRHQMWFPVTIDVAGLEIWSICRDISECGLLVSARQALPVGTVVTARFKLTPNESDRTVSAKVVRCEQEESEFALAFPSRLGLEFDEPDADLGQILAGTPERVTRSE